VKNLPKVDAQQFPSERDAQLVVFHRQRQNVYCILLALYWILAPAMAKNRPFLQIQTKSSFGQNVAGFWFLTRLAKCGIHFNTLHISTGFEKMCSQRCRIFYLFVYFVEITPSSRD